MWRERLGDDALFCALSLLLPLLTGAFLALGVRRRWFADGSPLPPRARAAAWNALATLLLLLLAHLGGEVYYRFVYDQSDSGLTRVHRRWSQRHYRLNSSAVRDDIEYTIGLEPGKRRFVFYGDSFTVGHGVRLEERFVNLIRRARVDRWEVHAIARPGLATGEMLHRFRTLPPGYRFSAVVLVYNVNDIEDLIPECRQIAARVRRETEQTGWLVSHGYLLNFLYHRWRGWRDAPTTSRYEQLLAAAYDSPAWDHQRHRLLAFAGEARRRGVPLFAVTFPMLDKIGERYPYRLAHEQLDAFWRAAGVPHLDLLPVFAGRPPRELTVNRFDNHPGPLAHRLAAEALTAFLDAGVAPAGSGVSASPGSAPGPW